MAEEIHALGPWLIGTLRTSTAGPGFFSVKPAATGFVAAFGFGGTSIANTGFTNCSLGNTSGGLFNSTLKWRAKIGYTFFKTGATGTSLLHNAGTYLARRLAKALLTKHMGSLVAAARVLLVQVAYSVVAPKRIP